MSARAGTGTRLLTADNCAFASTILHASDVHLRYGGISCLSHDGISAESPSESPHNKRAIRFSTVPELFRMPLELNKPVTFISTDPI